MTTQATDKQTFSLERAIRYRLILVMLPMLVVLMFIIHKSIHLLFDEIIVERLQHDALSLISALHNQDQQWQIEPATLPYTYRRVRSGHYFILQWQGGEIRSRSLWDKPVNPAAFAPGDTEDYLYYQTENEFWVIHSQTFIKEGEIFNLWVAEDISAIDQQQKRYEYILAGVLLLFTLFFILWQRAALKKGFALLEPVQKALEDNQLTGQLSFPQAIPLEIQALVDSIQHLLDKSSRQVGRSRTAVGNLAHELKRPLQELQNIAAETADPAQQQRLKQALGQLQHRIDAELKRARIAGNPTPGNLFTLGEELPYLEDLLTRIHKKELRFQLDSALETLPFDRDDMLELLGNLLDNAWKYAHSVVQMSVVSGDNSIEICVEDDGPGVSEEHFAAIKHRGVRVDEHYSVAGDGLGLSICQSIVESYNGSIGYQRSALGGLKVQVLIKRNMKE